MKDRTPGGNGLYELDDCFIQYHFDTIPDTCDIIFVWGGIPNNVEQLKSTCRKGCLVYLTEEAHPYRYYHPDFLAQFDVVLSGRSDIQHRQIIPTHEINTWHMGLTYDEAMRHHPIEKTKQISIVCSKLTTLPGHLQRFAFAHQLKGHFKDRIDFFGTAFQPIPDKWDALKDYKYSIAIENSQLPGYFTEKLTECFLAHCLPIYYGAPDIHQYFDENSFVRIDIHDLNSSIATIEALLEKDPYEQHAAHILAAKKRFLEQYHIFQVLNKMLPQLVRSNSLQPRVVQKIKNEKTFVPHYRLKKMKALAKAWTK